MAAGWLSRAAWATGYPPESFFEVQAENVENALWAGVRSQEEQASLAGVMASRAEKVNDIDASRRHGARRDSTNEDAELPRRLTWSAPTRSPPLVYVRFT